MTAAYFFIIILGYGVFGAIVAGAFYAMSRKQDGSIVDEAMTYMAGIIWPIVLIYGIGKLFFFVGKQFGKLFVE